METLSRPFAALALAALLGAATAAAQTTLPDAPPVAPPHVLWFDAGALADDEIRAGVDAITAGRFTFGAAIGYSHTAHPRNDVIYPLGYAYATSGVMNPVWCDPRALMLCAAPYGYYGDTPRYRAWTAAFTVRFYPASFSFRNGTSRMQVYAGAHAGYRWSAWDENVVYYGCYSYCPPVPYMTAGAPVRSPRPAPADSVFTPLPPPYPYPLPIIPGPNPVHHSRGGFEPGLDVGVRLIPLGPLFVEVGGRFTLATADDAMRRTRPGDVESRLVLAAGLAW